ncbi:MAG: hydantoinase/oxoprolinase family protein [Pseudomonadota bacterium]
MGSGEAQPVRAGVDIGGTFTDVALEVGGKIISTKVLTDHESPDRAVVLALEQVTERAGISASDITMVIHGTTLVTNALIERRGARTAFITTEGFRDVVEMRNENRFEQYDLNIVLPKPLVDRAHRLTLSERMDSTGKVLKPLDPGEADALAEQVAGGGYEAVAVGLMHAYANPAHERAMAAALARTCPDVVVSVSSAVSPQMREFERFNTVIANAYVQPMAKAYLGRLVEQLSAIGISCPVFLMHSGGGIISIETAMQFPVRLLESGPAGGAIYAANFALSHGLSKVVSFDMGGTTAKICLIEDGKPKTANRFEVARTYRFKKGSGMPVSTPVVEMVEIGAGGGSIAHVDDMGQIRVGPQSAGSEPGPACYQRGGERPAVTDANLVLGKIDAGNFAGGSIELSVAKAQQALQADIGERLGVDVTGAAFGTTEMVDENMANAARVHAVENGKDASQFALIAFGGGAPLHACRQAEKLGMRDIIIPPGAGVGSAIGFLRAPFSYEETRGAFFRLSSFDAERINQLLREMQETAAAFVRHGVGSARTETRIVAFMRYRGQGWEIPVPIPDQQFAAGDVTVFTSEFETVYRRLFGRTIDDLDIEIANWSVVVTTPLPEVARLNTQKPARAAKVARTRAFLDAQMRDFVDGAEVMRADLLPGDFVEGPALIVEDETCTIVTSAFTAVVQADGALWLSARQGKETDK